MKRMIVNADDFGFSEAVNHGILKGMQEGIVTSTSIMANMPGFAHAVQLYHEYPDMDMAGGGHLHISARGYPHIKPWLRKPAISTNRTILQVIVKRKCMRN